MKFCQCIIEPHPGYLNSYAFLCCMHKKYWRSDTTMIKGAHYSRAVNRIGGVGTEVGRVTALTVLHRFWYCRGDAGPVVFSRSHRSHTRL